MKIAQHFPAGIPGDRIREIVPELVGSELIDAAYSIFFVALVLHTWDAFSKPAICHVNVTTAEKVIVFLLTVRLAVKDKISSRDRVFPDKPSMLEKVHVTKVHVTLVVRFIVKKNHSILHSNKKAGRPENPEYLLITSYQ